MFNATRESPYTTQQCNDKHPFVVKYNVVHTNFPYSIDFKRALVRILINESTVNGSMTNVCILDNNALFKLNDGFSVVAPITVNVPFSITGNNKSCTALLNRCISSRNKIVLCPLKFYDFLLERKPPSTFCITINS